ncbi:MAG: tetratricopeptide repeat protein [Bacteroidales bacterium]|nr:tetratricopeptide repeat protein [Bacteroidales bacterium]
MRKLFYQIIVFVCAALIIGSCNKKSVTSSVKIIDDRGYDMAKFNYVYVEAIKQKLMGNGGDALKLLENAVIINPKSDAAYYQMAQIVSSGGDLSNAKKFLKKALIIDERNVWYLMMMAGFYYQEQQLDSAIFSYETAVKYFPEAEDLQLTLGNLYTENKNYDKAIRIFDSFDSKYGVNENSTVSLIRTLIGAEKYEQALEKARLLIRENPDVVLYNGLLAEIYSQKGESEKAKEVYNDLLERNPIILRCSWLFVIFLLTRKIIRNYFFF